MKKIILSLLVVTALSLGMTSSPVTAASGTPIGPSRLPCRWNGQLYPHGAQHSVPFTGVYGEIIRYDVYQCQNAKWVYLYSSDDIN